MVVRRSGLLALHDPQPSLPLFPAKLTILSFFPEKFLGTPNLCCTPTNLRGMRQHLNAARVSTDADAAWAGPSASVLFWAWA